MKKHQTTDGYQAAKFAPLWLKHLDKNLILLQNYNTRGQHAFKIFDEINSDIPQIPHQGENISVPMPNRADSEGLSSVCGSERVFLLVKLSSAALAIITLASVILNQGYNGANKEGRQRDTEVSQVINTYIARDEKVLKL